MENTLDIGNLFPSFPEFFQGEIPLVSPSGLSALFVLVLLTAMVFFVLWAWIEYRKAKVSIMFYLDKLAIYEPNQVFDKREEINEFMEERPRCTTLWKEFDESLVRAGNKLCNTLDASHFFNHYSLAHGLTDNRLFAAVPGFLTAIGVIGTFIGLQLGLGEIQNAGFGNDEAGVTEIKQGIEGMISGASIAFMTSVWGIGTSVLFNFLEKYLERNIRNLITALQERIDSLYHRLTAEESLAHIEGHSRESREIMQTLAEKIGDRMQKALIESTDKIKDSLVESLQSILGSNIEMLIKNANSSSKEALDSLVSKFSEAISKEGQNQRQQMEDASDKFEKVAEKMESGLYGFISKLDKQVGSITENTRTILEEIQTKSNEQFEKHQNQVNERDKELRNLLKALQDSQDLFTENQHEVMSMQRTSQENMLKQIQTIIGEVDALAKQNQAIGNKFGETVTAFEKQIASLERLSQSIQTASENLNNEIQGAIQAAKSLMEYDKAIGERMEGVLEDTRDLSNSLSKATNSINDTATKANQGLQQVEQHFTALADRLNKHSEDFSGQVSKLLTDYAEQVSGQTNDRLNQWNIGTQDYITKMTDAIQTLGGVVDEIEDKLSNRKKDN